jgi:H+-translocating NAD(P) transhydrogenase subunit alpha
MDRNPAAMLIPTPALDSTADMETTTTAAKAAPTVGILRETVAGERRVALTPDGVGRLQKIGVDVLVESGAGEAAWFPDEKYADAGARVTDAATVYATCSVLVCINPPAADKQALLVPDQVLIGMLAPLSDPALARSLAEAKVTAISLDGLPRTLSSAQSMDVLTSQANVAGYKAAIVAADAYGSYFPMLMTAAGTMRPAKVLVLGAGVAGLQAIGTTRRLGAVVTAYDVREAAHADVLSTGANFLDLGASVSTGSAASEGGYARELTAEERDAQQAAMVNAIAKFDVVITTAQVPGRRPPVLVSAEAIAAMQPGAVVVDIAASKLGGNVEGSVPGMTVVTDNGVTLIGASNLPASVPGAASSAYSRNISALIGYLVHDGELRLDLADPLTAGVVVTRDGDVVHPAVLAVLSDADQGAKP